MNRNEVVSYLKNLRDQIISEFQSIETSGQFEREPWDYHKGKGGGEMSVLRGKVFEKAAVNWSGVEGSHLPTSSVQAAGGNLSTQQNPFFATGVSLITHMSNPKMPTVHFNIRYIETKDKWWLGGGFDLTPMGFEFADDTSHFHAVAKKALQPFGENLYSQFSQQAKDYFFIKHYNRERGVGGIFFDQYRSGNDVQDFSMWRSVGDQFTTAIMPIYKKRIIESYTEDDRKVQLLRRAHYVEFNLLYDRGTKFGFESGGNPKAILCSMPPLAAW